MNNFDENDDLPFSPIEDNEEENKSVVTETEISNFFGSSNKEDNTDIEIDNIKNENADIKIDNTQNENADIKIDNTQNVSSDIKINSSQNDYENIFDNKIDNKDIIGDNLLVKEEKKDEIKTNDKKKYKNSEEYKNFVKKTSRILPVIAFVFVSAIGVYIFLNNVKADIINLIKIEENSKIGYIDSEGEVIVRAKYLSGTDYYKGYAIVKNYNSLYGIIDGTGNTEIPFGNIFSATLYDNRYVVSKFTNEGLKMGLLDENLEEITKFKYDNITYSKSGVFIFVRNETMGIMNKNGKEIYTYKVDEVDDRNVSIEVSNVTNNSSDMYAKIKINSSSTIVNIETGIEVYKYTLDDINVLDNNVFYIKNNLGGNRYFIIKNDEIAYETNDYKRVRIEDLSSNIAIGIKEDASIDYINLLTREIIDNNDGIKYTYSDGVILEEYYDFNQKKNIYDIYTPDKMLGTFTDLKPDDSKFENGLMKIKTDNNKYTYINKKGKLITKKEYEYAGSFNKSGYAIVANDNLYGVINDSGDEIIPLKYDEITFINDTLFKNIKKKTKNELFIYKENSKYGIINSKGKIMLNAIYSGFSEITSKYPIIKGKYNNENFLINLETFKELEVKVKKETEIYDNYIISDGNYYNYDGDLIYSMGG